MKFKYLIYLLISLILFTGCDNSSDGSSKQKTLLVPLYAYPYIDSTWDDLVALQKKYPTLDIVAIVNQSNGDFTQENDSYARGISALNAVGIKVIAYVYTEYSLRSIADVKANIDTWVYYYKSLGISGFFFDEASDEAQNFDYYETISNYAKSKGTGFIVLNPGAMVDDIYMRSGIASVIVTRETTYDRVFNNIEHFIKPTNSTKMALLLHSSDQDNIVSKVCDFAKQYQFDYIYATDHGADDDRWSNLSSYIDELAQQMVQGCR